MENFLEDYTKWLDESKEHLSNQAIATYLNLREVLSDKEKRFIENHLKSCSECKSKFERISAEDKEMDDLLVEEDSATSATRPVKIFTLQKFIRYSAAAAILIALALSVYYVFINKEEVLLTENNKPKTGIDTLKNAIQSDTTSLPKRVEPEKILEKKPEKITTEKDFAANDILENFVNRNIRSESEIKILQPKIGDTVHIPTTFKWDQNNIAGSNNFVIVNNKNLEIYEAEAIGSEIIIDRTFERGLYYWKIFTNDKLEAVGKFYIK